MILKSEISPLTFEILKKKLKIWNLVQDFLELQTPQIKCPLEYLQVY